MYPHPNPLRVRLAEGHAIAGLYIQIPSPDCVELAAEAGFDYVILDQEHGSFGMAEVVQMIRAAEATGVTPFVRVPDHDPTSIRRALEAGALGVYVPDIRSAEQARSVIAASRYLAGSNGGVRGACPTSRATHSQGADWHDFVAWSNTNVMVTLLIESQQGLDNIDEILKVSGIDALVLGRFDLAHELGLYGDRYGERLNGIFEAFSAKARAAGVPFVARLKDSDPTLARAQFQDLRRTGAQIFNIGSDRELIARSFRQALVPVRA